MAEPADVLLAALEHASEAVVIVDEGLRIGYANVAAADLFGIACNEMVGAELCRIGLPPDHIVFESILGPERPSFASVHDPSAPVEITVKRADGGRMCVSLTAARLDSGGTFRLALFVRDVSAEVERRDRLALLHSVADRTNRALVVTDRNLGIMYTNVAFAELFGYRPGEALGHHAEDLMVGPCTDPKAIQKLQRFLGEERGGEQDILVYDKDGGELWVTAYVKAFRNARGKVKFLVGMLTDIGESKQLRSLQQLITTALADNRPLTEICTRLCRRVEELAPDVVCSILHVDADGELHPLGGPSLPPAYSASLDGVAIGPAVGSCGTAAYLCEPVLARDIDSDPRWQPFKSGPLAAGLRACWSTPIKGKDGRVIGTFAFYFRECRGPSRWHQRIVDACVQLGSLAIERQEAMSAVARMAYYDMLTGLPNRAHIRSLIAAAIAECPKGGHVAVAYLDADNFKDINDTLGHAAGDEFLVAFAKRLRGLLRPDDMIGRLGGDEFLLLLPNRDSIEASLVAARISTAIAVPLTIGTRQVPMSASMGLSLYPDNASDLDTLIKQADAAMYKAKSAGRATYRFFSADLDQLTEQRLLLSAALRDAVAQERLSLHYQPQIRTVDGAIHGVEALARWHDPVLGDVSPAKFIPLAEECGLIEQIGLWSMREACRQMAAWQLAGLDIPSVSVNLSPINFQSVNLAGQVAQILDEFGVPPRRLILEITEGVFLNERATVVATMNELRELGVGLSLDDFGIGYSSLSRLAQLPISELKIDRSFMRDFEDNPGTRAIVTSVVRVGQSMKLAVVAEGVESDGQRRILAELGCDALQGFLYAKPLPAASFGRWLLEHSADRASLMLQQIGRTLAAAPSAGEATLLRKDAALPAA